MKTLEQYLKENHARGVIDHSIRCIIYPVGPTFYIHPTGKDGDTLDFEVVGNMLIPSRFTTPEEKIQYLEERQRQTLISIQEALAKLTHP